MKGVVPGKYNRVGEKKGPLAIGGAFKKMQEDSSFMYLPTYRVAGPEKDVKRWLEELKESDKLNEKSVKDALNCAYSLKTLEDDDIKEAFDKEVTEASEARANTLSNKAEMRQVNLLVLVDIYKKYREELRQNPGMNKQSLKHVEELKEKIKSLSEGKVLDVTNMKRKGTESKRVSFKEGGKKKRLSQQEGDRLYRVVYDPTNKALAATGVKNFLLNYGSFEASKIEQICTSIKNGETVNISRAKSPTRSPRLLSPRRKKAANTEEDLDGLIDGM